MKRLFFFFLILFVMATIAGLEGCVSAGKDYYSESGKDYPTYDYQGNRLMFDEGDWHLNRGYGY